jgi:hypothetical protein
MIELLAAAYIIGQVQISPHIIRTEYLNEDKEIIVVFERVDELE